MYTFPPFSVLFLPFFCLFPPLSVLSFLFLSSSILFPPYSALLNLPCLLLSFYILSTFFYSFQPFSSYIPLYSALYSLISFPYLLSHLIIFYILFLRSLMLYSFLYQYSLLLFILIPLFILAFYPLCSLYNVPGAFV